MIDPKTVIVTIPAYDGKLKTHCVGGLTASMGLFAGLGFINGYAAVNQARNEIANNFLKSKFEHLVCIDSDIGFTRQDLEYLLEGDEEAVCAEYARKVDTEDPNNFVKPGNAEFGLGFARIHRGVFERIADKKRDTGEDYCSRYFRAGELAIDFYPTGAAFDGSWFGEDHGFWHLARLVDATVRVERRTRLVHYGRKCWQYNPELSTPAGAWFGTPAERTLPDLQGEPANAETTGNDGPEKLPEQSGG